MAGVSSATTSLVVGASMPTSRRDGDVERPPSRPASRPAARDQGHGECDPRPAPTSTSTSRARRPAYERMQLRTPLLRECYIPVTSASRRVTRGERFAAARPVVASERGVVLRFSPAARSAQVQPAREHVRGVRTEPYTLIPKGCMPALWSVVRARPREMFNPVASYAPTWAADGGQRRAVELDARACGATTLTQLTVYVSRARTRSPKRH